MEKIKKLQEKISELEKQKKELQKKYRQQQQEEFIKRMQREERNNKLKNIIYELCQTIIKLSPDDDLLKNINDIKKLVGSCKI